MSKNAINLKELAFKGLKKLFLLVIAFITYWELYSFVKSNSDLYIYLENSKLKKEHFESRIIIRNGSQPITRSDIIEPININFTEIITSLTQIKSPIKPAYSKNKNNVEIDFALFNNYESFDFFILTNKRPLISDINYRIKGINSIDKYDYKHYPIPIKRLQNIWLVIFLVALLLLVDALLVLRKDIEFQKLKSFVANFKLKKKNKDDFIAGFETLYSQYTLRLKPRPNFMRGVIKNLFISFPSNTKKERRFIKHLTNLKTEWYIFYRVRTVFIVASPIVLILSFFGIVINFIYYDFGSLSNVIQIETINKSLLNLLLFTVIIFILFPSKMLNLLLVKKGGVKF